MTKNKYNTTKEIKSQADFEEFKVEEQIQAMGPVQKTFVQPTPNEFTYNRRINNDRIKNKRFVLDALDYTNNVDASMMAKKMMQRSNAALQEIDPDKYEGNSHYIKYLSMMDTQDAYSNTASFMKIQNLKGEEFDKALSELRFEEKENNSISTNKKIILNAMAISIPGLDVFFRNLGLNLGHAMLQYKEDIVIKKDQRVSFYKKGIQKIIDNATHEFLDNFVNHAQVRFNSYNQMKFTSLAGENYTIEGVSRALLQSAIQDLFGSITTPYSPQAYYSHVNSKGKKEMITDQIELQKERIKDVVSDEIQENKDKYTKNGSDLLPEYGPWDPESTLMSAMELFPFTHFFKYINIYDTTPQDKKILKVIQKNIKGMKQRGEYIPLLSEKRAYEMSKYLKEAAVFDDDNIDVIQFIAKDGKNPNEDNFYYAPTNLRVKSIKDGNIKTKTVRTEVYQGNYPGTPSNSQFCYFTYSELMDVLKKGNRSHVWDRFDAQQVEGVKFMLNHAYGHDGDSIEYALDVASTVLQTTSQEHSMNPSMLVFDGAQGGGKSTVANLFTHAMDGLTIPVQLNQLTNTFTLNEKQCARYLFDDDAARKINEETFSLTKKMTTGATMSSAGKNKDERNWTAKHGFIICTNHGLAVNGGVEGIGRRLTISYVPKLNDLILHDYLEQNPTAEPLRKYFRSKENGTLTAEEGKSSNQNDFEDVVQQISTGEGAVAWMQLQLLTRAIRISRQRKKLVRTELFENNAEIFEEKGNTFKQFLKETITENGLAFFDMEAMRNIKFQYSRWCEGNNCNEVTSQVIARTLEDYKFVKTNVKYGRRVRESLKLISSILEDKVLDDLIFDEVIAYRERNKRSYGKFSTFTRHDHVAEIHNREIDFATRKEVNQAIDDMDITSVSNLIFLIATDPQMLDKWTNYGFKQLKTHKYDQIQELNKDEYISYIEGIRFHIAEHQKDNPKSTLSSKIQSAKHLVEKVSDKEGAVPVIQVTEQTILNIKSEFHLTDKEIANEYVKKEDSYYNEKLTDFLEEPEYRIPLEKIIDEKETLLDQQVKRQIQQIQDYIHSIHASREIIQELNNQLIATLKENDVI